MGGNPRAKARGLLAHTSGQTMVKLQVLLIIMNPIIVFTCIAYYYESNHNFHMVLRVAKKKKMELLLFSNKLW